MCTLPTLTANISTTRISGARRWTADEFNINKHRRTQTNVEQQPTLLWLYSGEERRSINKRRQQHTKITAKHILRSYQLFDNFKCINTSNKQTNKQANYQLECYENKCKISSPLLVQTTCSTSAHAHALGAYTYRVDDTTKTDNVFMRTKM